MIDIEATTDPVGLEVYDSIEQRRLRFETGAVTTPQEASPTAFPFPVDTTCTIETDELVFDRPYAITLHDDAGVTESSLEIGETDPLDDRRQFVGVTGPIKLYVGVEAVGQVERRLRSFRLSLEQDATIVVGARSLHDRPAGTITTPPDLESMLTAVSASASALKTTSPERTWPTLRGHPPLIELGQRLEVPAAIDRDQPDTGVTLTIPPTYAALFAAAPLAFFLGADLQTGDEPALTTDQFERPLPTGPAFEDAMAQLLKRTFFLDCLARTEGIFQSDLHERNALEDDLPFDLAAIYDASLPERLDRYLEIPFERLEPYVPRWPLTAHVPAEPNSVELVPFVTHELGVIRQARGTEIDEFGETPAPSPATPADSQLVRSASESRQLDRSPTPGTAETALVDPDVTTESVEHAWFGDAIPYGASKATVEAYRNQLDRRSRKESIDILLVCNDARMLEEHDLLDDTYGTQERVPFDVDSEFGVDTDRLAALLSDGDYDFFHYIGHATEDGLRCPDGKLDVRTLESVTVSVFFLNACRSYEQGLALTRHGAYGGVGTHVDVDNEQAVEAGETMAKLLNCGFPLRGALEIARDHADMDDRYLIIGDGSTDIAQSDGGAPALIDLERHEDGFDFAVQSYSTKEFKLGTTTESTLPSVADRHLGPDRTAFTGVDREALEEYFIWNDPPVRLDGELQWYHGVGSTPLE
ncbi:hypothetical protein [Natronobacterium gregoryi]|uniref:CHAT domain-containing protein n=2 Tax=Natronobacterium gregoryi TaxID=44930 RepID=L0AHP0_NATGS|nr:hypothetical protein [Natronobacterium gregoryi]AFZ73428.1 hypothetical protein Natgr_2251 [Natronobacterium gregoryi SP2]ELY68624.1 hypothetical protein C490_09403 [Natronobacterium gregoryi SP2]PLK20463.1 hypothetical protein CYV19_09525 [Natronobacterium gregoryi SP2]SFI72101.1 hypothetical protein SAMN05443661_10475 [Natronobacterium gregoryi]